MPPTSAGGIVRVRRDRQIRVPAEHTASHARYADGGSGKRPARAGKQWRTFYLRVRRPARRDRGHLELARVTAVIRRRGHGTSTCSTYRFASSLRKQFGHPTGTRRGRVGQKKADSRRRTGTSGAAAQHRMHVLPTAADRMPHKGRTVGTFEMLQIDMIHDSGSFRPTRTRSSHP